MREGWSAVVPDIGRVMFDAYGSSEEWLIATPKGDVRFQWSAQFGPLPVTSIGRPRDLSHRHPFWRIVSLWNLQGRRSKDGRAIWHEPKKDVVVRVGRRLVVIEHGEEGQDW